MTHFGQWGVSRHDPSRSLTCTRAVGLMVLLAAIAERRT